MLFQACVSMCIFVPMFFVFYCIAVKHVVILFVKNAIQRKMYLLTLLAHLFIVLSIYGPCLCVNFTFGTQKLYPQFND